MEETLAYSNFVIDQMERSKLAPDHFVRNEIGLYCPKCNYQGPPIEHGSWRQCGCGLVLKRYGNALVITEVVPR